MTENPETAESFLTTIDRTVRSARLIGDRAGVLIACSGGADSVALAGAMVELADRAGRRWRLALATLDHGLREDAAEDVELVRQLAGRWSLPFRSDRADVAALARQGGLSLESAGRTARYDFLAAAAGALDCDSVATGHHADDNVETLLHRIVRGCGPDGLRGIRPRRRLGEQGPWLIRPMLQATRAQARAFCVARDLPWRDDPTNEQLDPTRNRIRHELLPMMRERLNPQVDAAIARLALTSEWLGQWLDELAGHTYETALLDATDSAVVMDARVLAGQSELAASQAIRLALATLGTPMGQVTHTHVQAICELTGHAKPAARIDLPGQFCARRDYERLVLQRIADAPPEKTPGEVVLACPGRTQLPDGSTFEIALLGREQGPADLTAESAAVEWLDADAIVGPLRARRWIEGDRFQPLGAPGGRKLSDFFIDAKVSLDQRRRAWLVCDDRGPVWVAPLRIDHRVAVTRHTCRLMRIEWLGDTC